MPPPTNIMEVYMAFFNERSSAFFHLPLTFFPFFVYFVNISFAMPLSVVNNWSLVNIGGLAAAI